MNLYHSRSSVEIYRNCHGMKGSGDLKRLITACCRSMVRMRNENPSSSFARLAPSHLGPSSVSVVHFPPCLGGFFLEGRIDDVPEFLAVFSYVAVPFTHRSSSWGQLLSTWFLLPTKKRYISTVLLNGPLSSRLLKKTCSRTTSYPSRFVQECRPDSCQEQ
jgi:hypothetical protein